MGKRCTQKIKLTTEDKKYILKQSDDMFHLLKWKGFVCSFCRCFLVILGAGKAVRQVLSSQKTIWQFLLLMNFMMSTPLSPLNSFVGINQKENKRGITKIFVDKVFLAALFYSHEHL